MSKGTTINSAAYCQTLNRLHMAIKEKRRVKLSAGMILLHDNTTPHTSRQTSELLQQFKWELLQHPPYSPNLAPCDYNLFGKLCTGCTAPDLIPMCPVFTPTPVPTSCGAVVCITDVTTPYTPPEQSFCRGFCLRPCSWEDLLRFLVYVFQGELYFHPWSYVRKITDCVWCSSLGKFLVVLLVSTSTRSQGFYVHTIR